MTPELTETTSPTPGAPRTQTGSRTFHRAYKETDAWKSTTRSSRQSQHPRSPPNSSEPPSNPNDQPSELLPASATSERCSSRLEDTSPGQTGQRTESGGLAESVMRTVVSNETDALKILFEAAQHEGEMHDPGSISREHIGVSPVSLAPGSSLPHVVNRESLSHSSHPFQQPNELSVLSSPTPEVTRVWNAYRFVVMGWLSAEEAVTLVDAFFQNMSPLSPVLDDFFADHANHYYLITREPMLCCMILTISSRYHTLPTAGGHTRGHLMHQRLWDYCQNLLLRIMLGQEKNSKAKTRTLGSVEALLLLVEWHPRALHVPPAGDGWDSDLLLTTRDDRDDKDADVGNPSRSRWKEDVINPSKRSDQMSWMILGCATSLAVEIGILNQDPDDQEGHLGDYGQRLRARRLPITKLLCLFQEHIGLRLNCKPMIPEGMAHAMSSINTSSLRLKKKGEDWSSFMTAWAELTKLEKSIADVIFPSLIITRHLLETGRYVRIIEHFRPLLSNWENRYLSFTDASTPFRDILLVEYQSTRIYTNSLGLQAIVERTISDSGDSLANRQFDLSSTDYGFIEEVLDACLETLKATIRAAEEMRLYFAPVRLFLRITTASVFLLKGLGLGVSTSRLEDSLDILTRAIAALKLCKPDDLHLSARYATLLDMHVAKLRDQFVPAAKPPFFTTRLNAFNNQGYENSKQVNSDWQADFNASFEDLDPTTLTNARGELDELWLSLPPDPSLQPFIPGDSMGFEWLGQNSLDFIWNMGLN